MDPAIARRTTSVAAIGIVVIVVLMMVARGCGASRTAHPPTAAVAQRPPTPAIQQTPLKAVVCVGRAKRVARTPTRRDLDRIQRQARKVKKGIERKTPKRSMPGELELHRQPNGTYAGKCLYGAGSGRGNY
jgi:hypothetical protein